MSANLGLVGNMVGPLNSSDGTYVASRIIKAGPGKLLALNGYSSNAGAQWIQLHDSATLPADAAVPVLIFRVAATSNFSIPLSVYGRKFGQGIVVCNSTTGPTKTLGAADIAVDAQFI